MPTTNNTNSNTDSNTDSNNPTNQINQEACDKYGISLKDIPTEPVEPHSRYARDDTVYGFVTEVSHDGKGTEIEIKDWGYCLENNTIEISENHHRKITNLIDYLKK